MLRRDSNRVFGVVSGREHSLLVSYLAVHELTNTTHPGLPSTANPSQCRAEECE